MRRKEKEEKRYARGKYTLYEKEERKRKAAE